MLGFLRKLITERPAPRTNPQPDQGPPSVPVAPPTSGVPPVMPLDRPAADDERQPPGH